MSKISFKNHFAPKNGSQLTRRALEDFYYNKYFSLWLDSIVWEGLDYQQQAFVMREFWTNGRVGAIKMKGTEGSESHPNGLLVLVPFAPMEYNIYRFPTKANAINLKGVKFIPPQPLVADEEIVLGWANVSHEPVSKLVWSIIERIVDTEMVIRMNLKAQKMPWAVGITPETENKMKALVDALESDDPALFVELDEADKAKALVSGAPYIIDKLYDYIKAKENDVRELLGLYNLGFAEKKEHLITSEVESNDEVITASGHTYISTIEDWASRVSSILGIPVKAELRSEKEKREEFERAKAMTKEDQKKGDEEDE